MISHAYECIFIHNRKCAGSSIITAFGLNGHEDKDFLNNGVASPGWSSQLVKRYRVFSVVRNPWDRFVSGWRYCQSTKDHDIVTVLRNLPATGHDYRHLTRLQSALLVDEAGDLVVDDLIRFESLQDDFNRVCDAIGKPRMKLPHVNRGRDVPAYRDVFTPVARELFLQHFGADVERFGYAF